MTFTPNPVTADAVRAYREDTGAGMMEAKRHLTRQAFNEAFGPWRTAATLEEKVEFILDHIAEKENF